MLPVGKLNSTEPKWLVICRPPDMGSKREATLWRSDVHHARCPTRGPAPGRGSRAAWYRRARMCMGDGDVDRFFARARDGEPEVARALEEALHEVDFAGGAHCGVHRHEVVHG